MPIVTAWNVSAIRLIPGSGQGRLFLVEQRRRFRKLAAEGLVRQSDALPVSSVGGAETLQITQKALVAHRLLKGEKLPAQGPAGERRKAGSSDRPNSS